MSHFDKDFDAIIDHTYGQKYWDDDTNSYCIIKLNENGVPINMIAWYEEWQLTLIDADVVKGLAIISDYEKKMYE